jgi:hypothetical protein
MLLCLRPTFDLVCETIGFATGFRGDLFHIALTAGGFATWTFLALSIAFSIYAIVVVIERFKGFPQNAAKAATYPATQPDRSNSLQTNAIAQRK